MLRGRPFRQPCAVGHPQRESPQVRGTELPGLVSRQFDNADEYAVSPDGMKMFGVLDLETEMRGCRLAIGLRNSHDKSMRLALTAGYRCSFAAIWRSAVT